MWSFFSIQETESDRKSLLCNILQLSFSNPGNKFICACDDDTFEFIKSIDIDNMEIEHFKLDNDWSIKKYADNFITVVKHMIEHEEHPIFISRDLYLTKEVPINEKHIEQGLAFIKKSTDAPEVKKELQYSMDLVYIKNPRFIETVEKCYREKTSLFDIEEVKADSDKETSDNELQELCKEEVKADIKEKEEEEEANKIIDGKQVVDTKEKDAEIKAYQTTWSNIPLLFADMDDGQLEVTEYISGEGHLSTENFFAYDKSWKLKEMSWKDGFKHNDNEIWGMNIRLDELNQQIKNLNNQLVNMLLQNEPRFMPLLNMRWSGNGIQVQVPRKEGLAHWSREDNIGFYNFIENIAEKGKLLDNKPQECIADYFLFNNHILFDKPDVKYITNNMRKSFGIMYFDYSKELLDAFESFDSKIKFGGYYCSYPKILDSFEDPNDVERLGTKTLKDADYTNEEEFKLYLDDLATFKYVYVDKDTPKNRIAECLKLGVVPRLQDDSPLLDLEDIAKDDEEDWEILSGKCREYYSEHLTGEKMAKKLLSFVFSK